jgi:hypothetical protein
MGGYVKERMLKYKEFRAVCQDASVLANCPGEASPPKPRLFQTTLQRFWIRWRKITMKF